MEVVLSILLLLFFTNTNIPGSFITFINLASYGLIPLLLIGAGPWQRTLYVATRSPLLLLLTGLAIASVLWSFAPAYTSDETKTLVRAFLFGVYLVTRYEYRDILRLFAWMVGIAAVLSVFFAIVVPSYGVHMDASPVQGLWKGIYAHKQNLGRTMTLGCATLFLTAVGDKAYRRFAAIGTLLAFTLVLLTESKTSLVVLIFALLLPILSKLAAQHYKLRVVLLIVGLLTACSVVVLIFSNLETIVVDMMGKSMELSSRTPIWNLALEKGWQHPWLGYGYSGFWTSDESYFIRTATWASVTEGRFHAHNGFIDLFLQLGLIGLGLYLIIFFNNATRAIVLMLQSEDHTVVWMLSATVIMFLFNTTEYSIFDGGTNWMLNIVICLSTTMMLKSRRTRIPRLTPVSY